MGGRGREVVWTTDEQDIVNANMSMSISMLMGLRKSYFL